MSKRLQVILDDAELREIKKIARARHVSVAAWVREVLRSARGGSEVDPADKLATVRTAARHSFPTGDIDDVLEQIERGYRGREA